MIRVYGMFRALVFLLGLLRLFEFTDQVLGMVRVQRKICTGNLNRRNQGTEEGINRIRFGGICMSL